jgi:hypothetical protein
MGLSYGFEPWVQYADSAGRNFAQGMSVAMEGRQKMQQIRAQQEAELARQQQLIEDEKAQYLPYVKALLKSDRNQAREMGVQFSAEDEPQIDGNFARSFAKAPGSLAKFLTGSQQRVQGNAFADAVDEITNHPDVSEYTKGIAKAYGNSARKGMYAPMELNTYMKEVHGMVLQDRSGRDIPEPVGTIRNLDTAPQIVQEHTNPTTMMTYKTLGIPSGGAIFDEHIRRANKLRDLALQGGELDASQKQNYNDSRAYMRANKAQFKDPAQVETVVGGFLPLNELQSNGKKFGGPIAPEAGDPIVSGRAYLIQPKGADVEPGTPVTSPYVPVFRLPGDPYKPYSGPVMVVPPAYIPPEPGQVGGNTGKDMAAADRGKFAVGPMMVNDMRDIADAWRYIDKKYGNTWDWSMLMAKDYATSAPGIGKLFRGYKTTNVPPEVDALRKHIADVIPRYEQALGGGARMIGSVQFLERYKALVGDMTNSNFDSNIESLAQDMQSFLMAEHQSAGEDRLRTPTMRFRQESEHARSARPRATTTNQRTSPDKNPSSGEGAGVSGSKALEPGKRRPLQEFNR